MILETIIAAYSNGDQSITLTGSDYATLQAEISASTTLTQYELDELAAYRWNGSLAIGVNYAEGQ